MFANQSYCVAPNPEDAGGGGGGGGGGATLPAGMVLAWATNTPPAGYLLCNGANYLKTAHPRLFSVIGNTYNEGSSFTNQLSIDDWFVFNNGAGQANITNANAFVSTGDIVVISNTTAVFGASINGVPLLITSAPAIGVSAGQITFEGINGPLPAGQQTVGQLTGVVSLISFSVPDLRLSNPVGVGSGIQLGSAGGSATTTLTITNLPPHSHTLWRGGATANQGSTNADSIGTPNVDTGLATGGNIYRATDTPTSGSRVQQVGQNGAGQTAFSTRNPYVGMNYIIKD